MANIIDIHVGRRLRAIRENNKIARRAVADTLDLPDTDVQDMENGERRLHAEEMLELCHVLGMEPSQLYEGLDMGGGLDPSRDDRPVGVDDRVRPPRPAR